MIALFESLGKQGCFAETRKTFNGFPRSVTCVLSACRNVCKKRSLRRTGTLYATERGPFSCVHNTRKMRRVHYAVTAKSRFAGK